MAGPDVKSLRVLISGRVQGVGFRYWVLREAEALHLNGWVRNLPDGRVEAVISGPATDVEYMLELCWKGPSFSQVKNVDTKEEPGDVAPGFQIVR